jgi:type II secretory pathway pseudopilin PulG
LRRSSAGPRAYSIAEVVVAIGVLSIGLLGAIGAISFGTRSSVFADNLQLAMNYSRALMDQIRGDNMLPWNNWPAGHDASGLFDDPHAAPRAIDYVNPSPPTDDLEEGVFKFSPTPSKQFTRHIFCGLLANNPNLARISIDIYWNDSAPGTTMNMPHTFHLEAEQAQP